MIALRRAAGRHRDLQRKHEALLTFRPRDRAEPLADGFGDLGQLDESRLAPGAGNARRPGLEAEVLTYMLEGSLAQEDSTGWSGVLRIDEFQRMSPGRRIRHSERNASQREWAHVIRVSLRPAVTGLECARQQLLFPMAQRRGVLCVVASPDGRRGSLLVNQDVLIYTAILEAGQHLVHELAPERSAWLHVVRGEIQFGDLVLSTGDGAGVTAELAVSF
ncbi:MAG TPA: pirin family protein, partial [Polyangia bacterium]|nr:pirin family protein [Polyangia bacterium]